MEKRLFNSFDKSTIAGTYVKDFYAGMPAVTQHSYGNGKAYYIATASDEYFYTALEPFQKTN